MSLEKRLGVFVAAAAVVYGGCANKDDKPKDYDVYGPRMIAIVHPNLYSWKSGPDSVKVTVDAMEVYIDSDDDKKTVEQYLVFNRCYNENRQMLLVSKNFVRAERDTVFNGLNSRCLLKKMSPKDVKKFDVEYSELVRIGLVPEPMRIPYI